MRNISKVLAGLVVSGALLGEAAYALEFGVEFDLNTRLNSNKINVSKDIRDLNSQIAGAYNTGNCVRFDILRRQLAGIKGRAAQVSQGFWSDQNCQPPGQRQAGAQISFGGGATQIRIPQVQGGTRIGGGAEFPIDISKKSLSGEAGSIDFSIPAGPGKSESYYSYFWKFVYGEANGRTNGSVPVGGDSVAFTYITPNPASGITGVGAGATGQGVSINSKVSMFDAVFGVAQPSDYNFRSAPRTATPPTAQPSITPTTGIGLRYRFSSTKHNIDQLSLTFPGVSSAINLETDSHFVAADLTVGFDLPAIGRSGFFGGGSTFIAPGILFSNSDVNQQSQCNVCVATEQNVSLSRSFNQTSFSALMGLEAKVGYKFNPGASIQLEGRYQYMTRVDSVAVPITPTQQPAGPSHGSSSNAYIGARLFFGMNYEDWN